MKVRAYLAKEEKCLVPSGDAASHIDLYTESEDPDQVKQLCTLFFGADIRFLDQFDRCKTLREYLSNKDIIYRKISWKGPGIYLLWLPNTHRLIYRSDILLQREIKFMIELEEHIELNSKGETDRKAVQL